MKLGRAAIKEEESMVRVLPRQDHQRSREYVENEKDTGKGEFSCSPKT